MDDAVDLLAVKYMIDESAVTDITLIETSLCRNCCAETSFQIVGNDNVMTCINQCACGMRTDVTSTA